jgi:hypothetical protein
MTRNARRATIAAAGALTLAGSLLAGTAHSVPQPHQATQTASADICDGADHLLSYISNANASVIGIGVVKSVDGHYDKENYDRVLPAGQRTDSWGWKCAGGYYIGGPGYCVDVSYWTGSEWKYGSTSRTPGLYQLAMENQQAPWRFELKVRRC